MGHKMEIMGMARKTIRINIRSVEQSLDDAIAAMKAISKGKRPKANRGDYFDSLEAARRILTENRLYLLRTIREEKPESVAELARIVERDFKHVHEDVELLLSLGLVKASASKKGSATRLTTDTTEIVFRISV
jgi:predicted transcriptional regulator